MHCRNLRTVGSILLIGSLLTGCGLFSKKEEPPLPGRRTAVLPESTTLQPDRRLAALQVKLPRPAVNPAWPQAGGYPSHAMHHLALGRNPRTVWQTSIGRGASDDRRILAQPVVGGGRIYAVDARAVVSAYDASGGQQVWAQNVLPKKERDGDLGGGIAYAGGRLFVTTGAAEALALDASSGKVIWRVTINAPSRSAPTVVNGRVFVLNVENQLLVLDAKTGKSVWKYSGVAASSTILGGASPAVSAGVVVVPLTSGDIVALRTQNGRQLWTERLAAFRTRNQVTNIADITGSPVIDRGLVFAVSNAGRLVAVDMRTGRRIWEIDVGSRQTPWVAGDYIFALTTSDHLIAVLRKTGQIRWAIRLSRFADQKQIRGGIVWAGPVLAGDRLIIAGSHGEALAVSPYTGEVIGWIPVGKGVKIPPLVAKNTIYFLTEGGQLRALR